MTSFVKRLAGICNENKSLVCIGLDPDPALMPVTDTLEFNRHIIDVTSDLVCAYKPNLAFYEALGLEGLKALKDTTEYIKMKAPGVIVIGDAKRGDIASSNEFYAKALYDMWGFDAITAHWFAGSEALEPFLRHEDRAVFIWCRSSNPGAKEFQDLELIKGEKSLKLFQWVAVRATEMITKGNVGLIVGATYPSELKGVREICPEMPILVPGIGAQGGDLASSLKNGVDANGRNLMISSTRGIIYASRRKADYADAARRAAQDLRDNINSILKQEGKGW